MKLNSPFLFVFFLSVSAANQSASADVMPEQSTSITADEKLSAETALNLCVETKMCRYNREPGEKRYGKRVIKGRMTFSREAATQSCLGETSRSLYAQYIGSLTKERCDEYLQIKETLSVCTLKHNKCVDGFLEPTHGNCRKEMAALIGYNATNDPTCTHVPLGFRAKSARTR